MSVTKAPGAGSKGSVLVAGAGVAGMHASLILADAGAHVYLVDSAPVVGGLWGFLDKTFPTHSCGVCHMSPRNPAYCPVIEVERHPRITLMASSRVTQVSGDIGDYRVTIITFPECVRRDLCDGCGECERVCPVTVREPSYLGMRDHKAIYAPGHRAVPGGLVLDETACTKCGRCVEACPRGAIDLSREETRTELEVGAIIVCVGATMCDPRVRPEYSYDPSKNVITGLEFERMVSVSGSTVGQLVRPGDGRKPGGVAFIQCVGSRDRSKASPYCSSVCCMYAVKEAIITKTLAPEARVKVFYMDLRALGKGYEEYYTRARSLGVEFENCRVSGIEEKDGVLEVCAEVGGAIRRESFDLVVLSNGLVPREDLGALGAALGVERDEFGFISAFQRGLRGIETSRPGIYVCGGASGPQDIPNAIMRSGACALRALQVLRRNTGEAAAPASCVATTAPGISPLQTSRSAEDEPRIGVFLCRCRSSMGSLDPAWLAAALAEAVAAKTMDDVVVVKEVPSICTPEGIGALVREVTSNGVNRVVAAACSPRNVLSSIEAGLSTAGVARGMVEVANVREQCGWVHTDPLEATRKACDLVAMGVAAVRLARPLEERSRAIPAGAVVVGGGPAGMEAAASLADLGHDVHLVEKESVLGGRARLLARTLDGADVGEILASLEDRVHASGRVTIHTSARVASIKRKDGGFRLSIVRDRDRTVGDVRGAERAGPGGAESPDGAADALDIDCGVVILATGGAEAPVPAHLVAPDGTRVLTQQELEARLWPVVSVPSDVRSVVMIQCAGSRDEARPYCSQVCCTHAIKNAIRLKEERPEVEVYVLHHDIRVPGLFEAYYERAREVGVVFVRHPDGAWPKLARNSRGFQWSGGPELVVEVVDEVLGEAIVLPADLVVLSAGVKGLADLRLAADLGVPVDRYGFLSEANPKVQPVDSLAPGVYVCGLARAPSLLADALVSAQAAAARAGLYLAAREARTVQNVSYVRARRCAACGVCVDVCAYGARSIDEEAGVAVVDEYLCRGCGACQAACPSGAASHAGFEAERIASALEASLG
ncbi:MAG: FAD-dependent oxidoreductase [Betaproteobacteria bacterium]